MNYTTVQQAIGYLCHTDWQRSNLGLHRVETLLERLGNPHLKLRFVHVAGTNGKGSTCALTASMLAAAGYKTGIYTSPYLYHFNERMQINGVNIPDEALMALTEEIRPHAEAMEDHPTEFELITVLAFCYFAQQRCDIVVLEVGLGGRLDATNVIAAPEVAVITAIGLDHTAILGDTLPQIAREKAGIIKMGCTTVLFPQTLAVEAIISTVCMAQQSALIHVNAEQVHPISQDFSGQCFDYPPYKNLQISLLGAHQLKNAAVALEVMAVLAQRGFSLSEQAIRQGLSDARWPGRFELLQQHPLFLVDGGHNPQCMEALAAGLASYLPNQKFTLLIGVLNDKDYTQMVDIVAPLATDFVTVTPLSPRAMAGEALATLLQTRYHKPVTYCPTIESGVRTACAQAGEDGAVCAFGSLYMTGAIRACFGLYQEGVVDGSH